ncbi:MAG: class I SAM-dependent methyltransferase [Candidatus Limnocylindrales bacterium]
MWGYRRLDPIPGAGDFDGFYECHYGALVTAGGRGPDLARMLAGGPDAFEERAWQAVTLHADVLDALEGVRTEAPSARILDIGCGTGELLRTLVGAGWDAIGTEPSGPLAELGRAAGLTIAASTASAYLDDWARDGGQPFAGIVLLNVLEHVAEPAPLVEALRTALLPGGRLIVRVPNDFSPLQLAAWHHLGGEPWWVAIPDHVNYFDHASIAALLERLGFEVVARSADFPMELFLLMGDDYRADPAAGLAAHRRRRRAELALDQGTRRAMGRAWAEAGLGRNAFVVARPA